jgi:hypothetical protein
MLRLSKIDVLVVDEWAHDAVERSREPRFLEDLRGPLPSAIADPDFADAGCEIARANQRPTIEEGILDRILHHAHRIALRGESLRKNPPKSAER